MKKSEERLKDLQNNIKQTNVHIIGLPERREKKRHKIFGEEIMAENSPNLEKDTDIQIQKSQRVPIKKNQRYQTKTHYN